MKVLIISDTFHPAKDGVVNFVNELARILYKVYDTTVMVPNFPKKYYPNWDDDQYPYRIIRLPVIPVQLHSYFWTLPSMTMFKEFYKADIIIFNSFAPLGFFGLLLANLLNKKKVLFVHHNEIELLHHAFDIPRFLKTHLVYLAVQVHRSIDHFVCATEKFRRKLVKLLGHDPRERVTMVPYVIRPKSVDPKKVEELRKKLGTEGKTVLLYLGRFSGEKNVERISEVMGRLSFRKDVICIMAGGGYLLDKIKRESLKRKFNIFFLGTVSDTRVWELYSISDLLITPTPHETISFTVLESMSKGVIPVVNGNYTESGISEKTAVQISDVNSCEEIYQKISSVINDKLLIEKMRRRIKRNQLAESSKLFTERWLAVMKKIRNNSPNHKFSMKM